MSRPGADEEETGGLFMQNNITTFFGPGVQYSVLLSNTLLFKEYHKEDSM